MEYRLCSRTELKKAVEQALEEGWPIILGLGTPDGKEVRLFYNCGQDFASQVAGAVVVAFDIPPEVLVPAIAEILSQVDNRWKYN